MSIDDMLLYHIIDVNQHFRQLKVHYAILHGLTSVFKSKYKWNKARSSSLKLQRQRTQKLSSKAKMAKATPTVCFFTSVYICTRTKPLPQPSCLWLAGTWFVMIWCLRPSWVFFFLYIYNLYVVSRERAFSTGYSEDSQWIKGSCQNWQK